MPLVRQSNQNVPISQKTSPGNKSNISNSPRETKIPLEQLAYLRIPQILGDKKANPPIEPLLPISRSQLYKLIQDGVFPAPLKLGRMSLWREDEVRTMLETIMLRKGK